MTTLMTRGGACLAASALVLLAAVAGCSQEQPGTAVGSGTPTPTGSSPSESGTPPRTTNAPAGDEIKPCDLVPSSSAAGLGLTTPGRSRTTSGRPACSWTGSDFSVLVGTSANGLANANGQSVPLAKHKAIQTTETGGFGGCGVIVEVSAKSSVIIVAVYNGGTPAEAACPKAVDVAKVVDTTLP